MSKHTPGPWALESVDTRCGSCHKIGPFPSAGVRSEVHACVYADQMRLGIDDRNPVAAELLANARLIAAAPELLEALVQLEEAFCSVGPGMTREDREDSRAALIAARAAIAKARGEA